jgi:small subunit ribosomal protein S6
VADYAGLPATVKELERNYRIDDRVIRYHTVVKAEKVNLEALQAEIAAKAKAAAPAPEAQEAPAPEAAAAAPAAPALEAAPLSEAASPAQED